MNSISNPFSIKNIRLFIAFRIFFNARFYYPVFTIIFLDYGLTIDQFALLNSVWAITIFCAEVPSGVLADLFGRRRLIIATSLLMVIEIAVIAFVPIENSNIIFWAFLINRILSGLAEAMASGADEAIAYDALTDQGNIEDWPSVLSVQMRLKSLASMISMTVGALVYDPSIVNRVISWSGGTWTLTQQTTMRFPIYLTLILAVLSLYCAFQMEEKKSINHSTQQANLASAFNMTWQTVKWIFDTPFVLAIIIFGMSYDHILRMITTMTSQYYRLIHLPEASFGVIGSGFALLGLFVPKIAEYMVINNAFRTNILWLSGITIIALFGLTGFYPYWGLLPMSLAFVAMMLVSFFTSHYLNRETASYHRATVLSFKGMAFNLAYGVIGVLFASLLSYQRDIVMKVSTSLPENEIETNAFKQAIGWFPWYGIFCLLLAVIFCRYKLKNFTKSKIKG
ncbi:MFS transporter [Psychromonas sp. PT13]|uniref:MFS transporter n=1 Tax=Psychromonas sp. PT13 TaxID=3439547 RepID=UPI003EB70B16